MVYRLSWGIVFCKVMEGGVIREVVFKGDGYMLKLRND